MKIKGILKNIQINKNTCNLIITVNEKFIQEATRLKNKNIIVTIEQNRSNSTNALFWKMLSEICRIQKINILEEYKRRIRELGLFIIYEVEADKYELVEKEWIKNGRAWFCDLADTEYINNKEYKILHLYFGSSCFTNKEINKLIDDLIQDYEQLGIKIQIKKIREEKK